MKIYTIDIKGRKLIFDDQLEVIRCEEELEGILKNIGASLSFEDSKGKKTFLFESQSISESSVEPKEIVVVDETDSKFSDIIDEIYDISELANINVYSNDVLFLNALGTNEIYNDHEEDILVRVINKGKNYKKIDKDSLDVAVFEYFIE